ncbi:MAG: prepilin-type N-terminal cleavage/methylation domain-containing protein [Patescibacteria group bacterium]
MISKIKKFFSNQTGQSLLELIVAMAIINVGLFAVWALFLSNFSGEQEAKARIVGVNLAREGVEAVKNIRDSNWLRLEDNKRCGQNLCSWDYGLVGPGGDDTAILVDLFETSGEARLDFGPDSLNDNSTKIFIDQSLAKGFFIQHPSGSAQTGQPTIYRRLITLDDICCSDINGDGDCDDNAFKACSETTGSLKVGLEVSSRVQWLLNGKSREVVAEDHLFNWK